MNAFATQDWVLAYLYRTSSLHRRSNIAGLVPIPCPGVESIRLDGTLQGHHTYGLELYGLLSMVELGQAPNPNPNPKPLQPE